MTLDWKALSPTRPLDPAETEAGKLYVRRDGAGAAEVDLLFQAGLDQPVAFFGPAGAGKSTELAALVARRATRWHGTLVRLDRVLPYSDTTSIDDVLDAIAVEMFGTSPAHIPIGATFDGFGARGRDRLLGMVRAFGSDGRPVGILVDGLEKASEGLARRTLTALGELRGEAQVIVVAPMEVITGQSAHALADYHLVSVGPVNVVKDNPEWARAWERLFELVGRRLGIPDNLIGHTNVALVSAMRRAIQASGGLVRTYLQLLQKAALYGAVRGATTPTDDDVARAEADQTAFMLRLLKDGDAASLRAAHGTSGLEVETSRKVRFLANGLLLEYPTSIGNILRVAPLLTSAIGVHVG